MQSSNIPNKIIEFIKLHKQARAVDIVRYVGASKQIVFRHLARLIKNGVIGKKGLPPKVFYFLNETQILPESGKDKSLILELNAEDRKVIDENFFVITATGERQEGIHAFIEWCNKRNQPVAKTAADYAAILAKYAPYKKDGLIDGITKMKNTFPAVYLDKIFYFDFYSIDRFGKTKLGQLLLYAKQSQDKNMIREVIDIIRPRIVDMIARYKIDGVGFIPPTVKRETQFMAELRRGLHLDIPEITIDKIRTQIIIPQKTLSKLEERIENVRQTFAVGGEKVFNNILLIDDAIGSGATLNEIAFKIKDKKICRGQIIGAAITGSFKGFDVISEV